jgi:hypothetical protein
MNLSQVLPRFFVGSCPTTKDDIDHLKADYGVTAIYTPWTHKNCVSNCLRQGFPKICFARWHSRTGLAGKADRGAG